MSLALWDIDQYLRSESKYKDNEMAQEIREKMFEIMGEYGLSFDDLIQ
jgi:RNase P/RNase MRP subunit POP5